MFIDDPILDVILRGLILTALAMVWIVVLVRANGLRSFSKMTNFDFVMTVAVGSLLASAGIATNWSDYSQALIAIAALFLVQSIVARLRKASNRFEEVVQNKPIVLMNDGTFVEKALKETRVSKDDVVAKLREANVLNFNEVRAVVLETTGDISVLHGDRLEPRLLSGVNRH